MRGVRGQELGVRGQGLAPDSLTRQLPTTPRRGTSRKNDCKSVEGVSKKFLCVGVCSTYQLLLACLHNTSTLLICSLAN